MNMARTVPITCIVFSLTCLVSGQIPSDLLIIDTHNDLPYVFREHIENNLTRYDFTKNLTLDPVWGLQNCPDCNTDLPRMREGKIGAEFWVAYADCNSQYRDAVAITLEQIDVIKRFVNKYNDHLHFATSVSDILTAKHQGKIASLIGVEGGHSIDYRAGVLRMMYDLGARYLTLTHNCQTPWGDSNIVDFTNTTVHNLTEFGKKLILEMNRIGMLVDLSHVSHNVMNAALNITRAPVIFSHSSVWSLANHPRNVHDDTLTMLRKNGGVLMVNFYPRFITNSINATIEDVAKHINYVVNKIGIDHVGIGSDYSGVPIFPQGLEDISKVPNLFEFLQQQNATKWTAENLRKLAWDNFIRVFKAVEAKRDELTSEEPLQDWISQRDLTSVEEIEVLEMCTTVLDVVVKSGATSSLYVSKLTISGFFLLLIAVSLKTTIT